MDAGTPSECPNASIDPTELLLQAHQFWRSSAWADAMYSYDEGLVSSIFWLDLWAVLAFGLQGIATRIYLNILWLCGKAAAGSWWAWIPISIFLAAMLWIAVVTVVVLRAVRESNMRPRATSENLHSGFEDLCDDICRLEEAQGLLQAFVQGQLGTTSQLAVACQAGNLAMQRHLGGHGCSSELTGLSNLQLLLTIKTCNEMIANLRGRLAATCHKVTGLWLTDVTEAKGAMHRKLANPGQ